MASIDKVVDRGICVGCGACSIANGGAISMSFSDVGVWQANLSNANAAERILGSRVCPFADESPDEDVLSSESYSELAAHPALGRYRGVFAAQVTDLESVRESSSGGLTTWILRKLLETGLVDGVIHVGPGEGELFQHTTSYTVEDLLAKRKSAYHSTTMADAVRAIRGDEKRYAVVGVPCFITAARLLARQDEVLRGQLRFFVGLVCGHLKSAAFAELLAWQVGVRPDELAGVDFRVKDPSRSASDYDFAAVSKQDRRVQAPTRSLLGGNWGLGMFQLEACNYCDDVFAETADVVLADAWLPEYVRDWRGTNIVVTRDIRIAELLEIGADSGEIRIEPLDPSRAALSQAGNYRHRRQGLALRLYDDSVEGIWHPRKRVEPTDKIPRRRRRIVRARRNLSAKSHGAFLDAKNSGSLEHFHLAIAPEIVRYETVSKPSLRSRALNLPRRTLAAAKRRLLGR